VAAQTFTTLYSFSAYDSSLPGLINSDGAVSQGGLVISSNTLFGTAVYGGSSGWGTVFAVNTDGTGFTTLYSFSGGSDGKWPGSGVVLSGNTLYGTTGAGGNGIGNVFAINTDGSGFTDLYDFTYNGNIYYTNSEGYSPNYLVLPGNTLYGTATSGGSSGLGTVFKVNTDGSGFTTLYTGIARYTGRLGLSGSTLYWTSNNGDVSTVNTDGTGLTTLSTGGEGTMSLLLSGDTAYGTIPRGGSAGHGTVFSLVLPPQRTLIPSGLNVILTWPTNATGFTLQSTTNLGSSAAWSTNLPTPVIINDQNVVTNPITGAKQFFRLSQ
jgi:uncharacterized repeat protein (TIGR03803 family)